jgi:Zn-dependent protease
MGFLDITRKQFLLAHVTGIPVRIDMRWFFVLALMSWATGNIINARVQNGVSSLVLGLFTTLVFFASIFFHELAHAYAARMEGVEVMEIVLHPFGGLARFRKEPDTPRAEFRIAIAGPAASFLLAVVFLALMALVNWMGLVVLGYILFLLGLLNFMLAVFNLFPGYPLDGGRVLRAYLWRNGKDLNEATILTGRCGQVIGVVMIVFAIYTILSNADNFVTGAWTVLVGLFLYDAAKGIIREVRDFEGLCVVDAMQMPVAVAPGMNVTSFVEQVLPLHRQVVFPVARDRQLYGTLMLEDLKSLPREKWHLTEIRTVMRPVTPDHFIEAEALLPEAQEQMRANGIGAVSVIDAEGHLVGFLLRGKVKKRS